MRLLAILALFVTAPCSAWAQPSRDQDGFPIYDAEARCRHHFSGNPGICIDAEQRDYDLARMLWPNLSPEQRVKCAAYADTPEPRRYAAVSGCVTLHTDLNDVQRRQATTKFRY